MALHAGCHEVNAKRRLNAPVHSELTMSTQNSAKETPRLNAWLQAMAFITTVFSTVVMPRGILAEDRIMDAFNRSQTLLIDGKETSFDTPSPDAISVRATHPRLMANADDIELLREKLSGPLYLKDVNQLIRDRSDSTGPASSALVHLLYDDRQALAFAKDRLLRCEIKKWGWPFYDSQWVFAWACTYDWLHNSLTDNEKVLAWENFRDRVGDEFNFSAFENSDKFLQPFATNHNDEWGKRVTPYEGVVALAIHGDGVADAWAQWTLDQIRQQHHSFCSPWGRHGMIDWMNLMSMDTGGSQAETADDNAAGYIGFYAGPTMLVTGAWSSATDQNLWSEMNFFRYWPLWNTYDNDSPLQPGGLGLGVMESVAGKYSSIAPEMAGLASWYLQQHGRSDSGATFLPRLIWGDLRLPATSPDDLNLPTAKYLRGADLFVSRSNWSDSGVSVAMRSRYLDTLRYEGESGCIWVYRNQKPILVRPRTGKWHDKASSCSGLGFRNPRLPDGGLGTSEGACSTYWGLGPRRAQNAFDAATRIGYFPNCQTKLVANASTRLSSTRMDHLYHFDGVRFAQRTLVHVPGKDLIVTFDQFEIDDHIQYYSTMRLPIAPSIQRSKIVWGNSAASVLSFDGAQPIWIGGEQKELLTPWGEWKKAKKFVPGYSVDEEARNTFGLGSVWTHGTGGNTVVTAIRTGSKTPPSIHRMEGTITVDGVTFEVSDREVHVSNGETTSTSTFPEIDQ